MVSNNDYEKIISRFSPRVNTNFHELIFYKTFVKIRIHSWRKT